MNTNDPNLVTSILLSLLNNYIIKSISVVKTSNKRKIKLWITLGIIKSKKIRKKLRENVLTHTDNVEHILNCKQYRN